MEGGLVVLESALVGYQLRQYRAIPVEDEQY